MSGGAKIIEGLKDAVAGNFSSVYIEGQHWVRADWQPIETAPKDGTRVLVADENVWMAVARNWPCNGYWIEDAASGMRLNPPTHWMPLPSPPVQER